MFKKLVMVVTILVMMVGVSFADPFLVCDPQTNVTHYVVTLNGATIEVPAFDLGDGTVALRYDLKNIVIGNHSVEVRAKNVWDKSIAVPFAFVKSLPEAPTGIGVK